MQAPTVVTKEVPVEVIKTVIKEVPVEVVKIVTKEVPIEVVKEVTVEVIKEVEKPLPPIYKIAYEAYLNFSEAKFAANQGGVLKGVKSLNVSVSVEDDVKNDISSSTIKTKIELELRKLGVRIDDNSEVTLGYYLAVMPRKGSEELVFSETLSVTQMVTLPRETGYIRYPANIWEKKSFGSTGKIYINKLAVSYDDSLADFLNDYLTANPRAAN